jgi:phospholipase C
MNSSRYRRTPILVLLLLHVLLPALVAAQGLNKIEHIVFIVKENRTFDNYFGTFEPPPWGTTTGLLSTGATIPLYHTSDSTPRDICHTWVCLNQQLDNNKMDNFDLDPTCPTNGLSLCMSQLQESDIPNYFAYAHNFVLADNTFSSIRATSFPNHLYTIAATSAGIIDQARLGSKREAGCEADPGSTALFMDQDGNVTFQYPCIDVTTLGDELTAAGITWTSYGPNHTIFNPYLAINHIYNSSQWQEHISYYTNFVKDAESGNMSTVSWIAANGEDEHPPASSCLGENWTVQQINAIIKGPNWNNTVIFVMWDDPGGFYEHIQPPSEDEFGLGSRVPMLIISPYAISGKISHTQYEASSVLKFIEERFNLPFMTERDANANDMLDSFDFNQTPLPPLTLPIRTCPVIQSSLAFQPQVVQTKSEFYYLTYSNSNGNKSDKIMSVVPSGDFTEINNCGTVLAGATCTIQPVFHPTAAGLRTGTLTITDNLGGVMNTHTVALSGIGALVQLGSGPSTTLNFGTSAVGVLGETKIVVLNNFGTTPTTINGVSVTGDFTQSNNCGNSLAAKSSCNISVSFTPTAAGNRPGTLSVNDSDPSSPQVLALTGVGATLSANPGSLNFGNQPMSTNSVPQSVVVRNLSNNAVSLSGDSCPGITTCGVSVGGTFDFGDFSQINDCGSSIPAKGSCTVQVTFTPTRLSLINTPVLLVSFVGGDSPLSVTLSGNGVASTNNAVPLIFQPLVPPSVAPGGKGFTLTVHGTGFTTLSTINWNGQPLTTQVGSSKTLSATVPPENIATAGTATVTASTPGPGGGISNAVPLSITRPGNTLHFVTQTESVDSTPNAIVSADFNGDGIMDLAVAGSSSIASGPSVAANQQANGISILLGNGDGTFTTTFMSTGFEPGPLAVGDFNGDGIMDLAVGDTADARIQIFLGNGNGTFRPAPAVDCNIWAACAHAVDPVAIVVADFNGDGHLDLAVLSESIKTVSILLGAGDGTFRGLSTPAATLTSPVAMTVGDFNNDGNADLAIANSTGNTVTILFGGGDGSFQAGTPLAATNPVALVAADFNGDGNMDLAVVEQSANAIGVFLGNGNGSFQVGVPYATGTGPSSIVTGDFNGTRFLDLVTANTSSNTISLLLGTGTGTFQEPPFGLPSAGGPLGLTTADFNGNGKADLAITNSTEGSVSILLQ